MSVIPSVVKAGTNNYQTPAGDVSPYLADLFSDGIISSGDLLVTALGTPSMNVSIAQGSTLISATPTSEALRKIRSKLSASYTLAIGANSSGSTKYDLVYMYLSPALLANPPATGDLTEAVSLLTERHNTSGESLTAANALLLAEVAVINNATSITSANITDRRFPSVSTGILQYVQNITGQGPFTSETNLTSLTFTLNFPANWTRKVRMVAQVKLNSTVNSDSAQLLMYDGGTLLEGWEGSLSFSNVNYTARVEAIFTPTPGLHTVRVSALRGAGTGNITMIAAATNPAFMYLEAV